MIKNAKIIVRVAGALIAALAIGCGGAKVQVGGEGGGEGGIGEDGKPIISKEAREDFDAAVVKYNEAKKEGWNADNCEKVAKKFGKVADAHGGMAEAMYNVGVVYRECDMKDKAKAAFEDVLKKHKDHQLSMAHLAVLSLEQGKEAEAEEILKKAVAAGRNTVEAVPAYTLVATILRERAKKGDGDAWGKSQKALRTALAIDSKHMPALYQLTMLYFDIAVNLNKPSYLTLASLVFEQGRRLDPEYAPLYHALGKIQLQKNELVEALKSFEAAFQKDPSLFEAYMSFGAINLNFRGYEQAKFAFEKAIGLKPNSYDAHMGLGVAARGLEDYTLARAEYKKAAEIDPKRTDYIFNLGLLEMDYENDGTPAGYEKAQKVFEKFLEKATEEHKVDPDGKGKELSWYAKAEKRIEACKQAAEQIREAEKEMAELEKMAAEQAKIAKEAEEMQKKAEELAKQEQAGAAAPGEGEAVDEAAIEAELEAEEKAVEDAAKAEEAAKEAVEAAEKEAEEAAKEAEKAAKEKDVDLE